MSETYNPYSLAVTLLKENDLLESKLIETNVVENSKEAQEGVAELLKFLFLCANHNSILTPSLKIDVLWHEFILFSRSYMSFCHMHFSKYIHHQPSNSSSNEMHQYQSTIQLYLQYFGSLNTKFWVTAGVCENHCGSCEN